MPNIIGRKTISNVKIVTKVIFTAELDYSESENIVYYHLDPVVRKYDSDSYFDAESPGRWISIVGKYKLN